jgi:hypothetical protein
MTRAKYPTLSGRSKRAPQMFAWVSAFWFIEPGGFCMHFLANKFLTFINNVLTDLNLTDVETGYKAARAEIAKNMIIESRGFGFEIEFVAKCKKIGARAYEVPISCYGRTYEEGKKIGLKDGLDALWYLIKFNILTGLKQSFRQQFLESKEYPKRGPRGTRSE